MPEGTDATRTVEDIDVRGVDRIVAAYLVIAGLWIIVSGPATAWMASAIAVPQTALEIGKGLAFVLATALSLRTALRSWAHRVEAAAIRERDAAEHMRHAQELRAAFLNGVSHELRTPLTSIIGFGDTVQRLCRANRVQEAEQLASRLVGNAHRLEQLVLDLLDTDALLQGMGTPRLRRVGLAELVERVALATDLHDRHLFLDGPEVEVEVDVAKFERVVGHLLANVARHTDPGTNVWIVWSEVDGELDVRIEDDGPGFPADLDLLDPFVQGTTAAAGANPGVGIGLTLANQYIQLHGGRMTLGTRDGGGARIDITVPLRSRARGEDPVTAGGR